MLWFGKRQGNEKNWFRTVGFEERTADFWLGMTTENGQRKGFVAPLERNDDGQVVLSVGADGMPEFDPAAFAWQGDVGADGPPLRATCVAAGICDDEGNELRPAWR